MKGILLAAALLLGCGDGVGAEADGDARSAIDATSNVGGADGRAGGDDGNPGTDSAPDISLAPEIDAAPDGPAVDDVDAPPEATLDAVGEVDAPGPGPDLPAHPPTCDDDGDCDDGRPCTTDRCEGGHCAWELAEGSCLIHSVCRDAGSPAPENGCQLCDPDADPFAWTTRAEGSLCDDQSACTDPGTCQAGVCETTPVDCGDGDPCTLDTCDPVEGCQSEPLGPGFACDDGDPCTTDDRCRADGGCGGTPVDCDDGDPCTDDACGDDGDCTYTFNTAPCGEDDGDPCTTAGVCDEGACVVGGPVDCDDGDACTIDLCDPEVGCYHLPTDNPCCVGATSICDDGDPCTIDRCDPVTLGCTYEDATAACDDGDECTEQDTCSDGACIGVAVDCDDGDPCTIDFCETGEGCQHAPASGMPCDDGIECTTDDTCVQGQCVGDEAGCVCTPTFADAAVRVTTLTIGEDEAVGDGLDIDGDGEVDNAFHVLAPLVNEALVGAVEGGALNLVFELGSLANGPVVAAVHTTSPQGGCSGPDCSFVVDPVGLDEVSCEPKFTLSGSWTLPTFDGGGQGSTVPFSLPLSETAVLELTLNNVRLRGTATLAGAELVAFDGVLAGAIAKGELLAAIDLAPPGSLPLDAATVKSVVSGLVDDDVDADGDGVFESSSIGLPFSAVHVSLVAE